MSLTSKAVFVVERNLDRDLSLDAVAAACGVSRFHLAHAFAAATGRTVMDYARARRLSEAARALLQGAPNILNIALAAGYTSHEAFSRAFRARFNITPEDLRKRADSGGLNLEEVYSLNTRRHVSLAAPQIKSFAQQLFVGLSASRRKGDSAQIPAQWRAFMSRPYHQIAYKENLPPVGVTLPGDAEEEFVYVCAAPVSRFGGTPAGLNEITVAPAQYAVFAHDGHVSDLPNTYAAIWNDWFPASGRTPKRAASLEHHNPSFDPRTGEGGVTLWIPLAEE
jgi:AraC family transcriptional regulator